ncbi:hypothetical protein QYF36_008275 [Acer negundo]|nr:hypothetical protein QYF36_008275 [Acer negundo]
MELPNKPKKLAGSYFFFRAALLSCFCVICNKEARDFVGGETRHQQLHHYCSDVCEMEAMEAYKKELEEYNNSIAAATDDNQQPYKELVEEEEHITNTTTA